MKLVLLFLFILRVHVTVGDPVSVFALKVTPHLLECPQKKKFTRYVSHETKIK